MKHKKGESASNAGAFLAVITVIIVLYILFLPPGDRQNLLYGNDTNLNLSGNSTEPNVLLKQLIGRVDYVNTQEKSYDIPTVRIDSPVSAQILKSIPSVAIRNALFDKDNAAQTIDFDIDKTATKNTQLTFNVKDSSGPLLLQLNGREIFNAYISVQNIQPIKLDSGYLADKNTLTFSVSSPGWAFWKANKYGLENVQIIGDVTDYKNAESVQYFTVSEAEKNNLNSVRLYMLPQCDPKLVGPLQIDLNKRTIFKGVADCGARSNIVLDNNYILQGANELKFYSDRGTYLLDNMNVKIQLDKPTGNTYYFEIGSDYFQEKEERATCGDYDGICPLSCSDTQDADCCFRHNGYWCAYPTSNNNDRCVAYVDASDCDLCRTGYYDSSGDPPKNCEGTCGDNTDDVCPSGCSSDYDSDCCFEANADNFWCKEVPVTGISAKCKLGISYSECEFCPSGYYGEDGATPDSCTTTRDIISDNELQLLSEYDVKLTVRFKDNTERKRVELNINGHRTSIDTTSIEYTKIIDSDVRKGTNSIEIVPKEDIDIVEMLVEIKRIR